MVKYQFKDLAATISTVPGLGTRSITVKRFVDIIACFALIPLLPILAAIAVAIRMSSPGPILYRAKRVGFNGEPFTMYKFRTMRHVDESASASVITARNDQRVFLLGAWLRRLKLDELPQLANILKGDMSLIGPRPEDPQIVENYYTRDQLETLLVAPGLASPGSIYNYTHGDEILGEHDAENAYLEKLLPIKLALDTVYAHEASILYDLRILLRTVYVILSVAIGRRHFPDPPEMEKATALLVADHVVAPRVKSRPMPAIAGMRNRAVKTNDAGMVASHFDPPIKSTPVREHFLPFSLPDIDESELMEIKEVLDTGWITTGPKTRQFEQSFAETVGAKYAVAVNSCTAAMHLALEAIGLQPGDFVLTSPYTFAATAEVIRYFNATPVFVDVEPDTLNLDPLQLATIIEDLEECLASNRTPKTVAVARALGNDQHSSVGQANGAGRIMAIMPVHFAGLPVDMDAIYTVAADHGLAVIEDAAHAFPAKYKEWNIGQDYDSGVKSKVVNLKCYSFYSTKTITTAEGGMICTGDEALADRCRLMSLHGISKDAWKRYTAEGSWYYEIIAPGFKYNLTDIASAMGLAQLRKSERMWERRHEIAQRYNEAFCAIPGLQIPADRADCQHAWHLYALRLNQSKVGISHDQFIEELKAQNIGTSVHFIPLHLHPYYHEVYGYEPADFPTSLREYSRVVSLPIYSKMSDEDVEDVIQAIEKVIKNGKNHKESDTEQHFQDGITGPNTEDARPGHRRSIMR